MRNFAEQQHQSPRDVPPVGRPRGATWRSLQADGVVWEGQVLLVGDDVDLAARMIVTHRRVVFVRGGDIVLEVPRAWLRQEPVLRRDGILELFVTTPDSNPFAEPMRVPLRMREGHPAAGHIIAMLAPGGVRRIAPDAVSAIERAKNAAPTPIFGGFWDDVDAQASQRRSSAEWLDPDLGLEESASDQRPLPSPVEPRDRLMRVPSNPPRPATATGFTIAGLRPRDQRRSPWTLVLQLAALTLLLGTAAALGAGRLNLPVPGLNPNPVISAPTQTVSGTTPPDTTTDTPAAPADSAVAPENDVALEIGVGGPTADGADQPQMNAAPESDTATAPTSVPVVAPTKPAIPTPAPASEDDPAATVADAAPQATEADPATEPAPNPGAASAPPAVAQPAAVSSEVPPAQEIVVGTTRLAIPRALRAESLPDYGLAPGSGDWVLVTAELTNEGAAPASLSMADIRLFDRGTGTVAELDSGTDVIASLAGITPARGASDTIALDPGAATEALFLYLLPDGGSDDLALLVGDDALDLAPSFSLGDAPLADAPQLVEAKVTEVINAGRIAVELNGVRQEVQLLGVQAPVNDACFAAEATGSTNELVKGQSVWLERQASDTADDGALLRDVWFTGADGGREHLAARLVEAGAATVDVSAPDTRYQAWLEAAGALARDNGAGLWSTCGQPTASGNASTPELAYMLHDWHTLLSDRRR